MAMRATKDVAAIMADTALITAALAAGVRQALVRHLQAGLPVVEWRDGKTVWLGPDEIRQRIAEMDRNAAR